MSGTAMSGTSGSESNQKWADLDSKNERLVDATHPLLAELQRPRPDRDVSLPAAS